MEREQRPQRLRIYLAVAIAAAVVASFAAGYLAALAGAPPSPTPGLTLVDDAGRFVTVPVEVKRVVTLGPSVTEITFAIGL